MNMKSALVFILCLGILLACPSCGKSGGAAAGADPESEMSADGSNTENDVKYERVVIVHDKAPVMRFMLISDVHNQNDLFRNAINETWNYAQTQEYKGLDAVVAVGDLSNTGTKEELTAFKAAFDSATAASGCGAQLITCMGNHDFGNKSHSDEENAQYIAQFESIMGQKSNEVIDINGFRFIAVSPSNHSGNYINQAPWLIEQLNAADSEKPLFVLQHYQLAGTVYQNGDPSNTAVLKEALSQKKNVIDFTGHSHAPITNRRSLYQGESGYTVYNTGSLSNTNAFDDDTQGSGYYSSKQFSIVEVYEDNTVDIKLYDLESNAMLGTVYQIGGDVNNTQEFLSKATGKPTFAADAAAIADTSGATAVQIRFPQAIDDDGVEKYRIDVTDSTGKTVSSVLTTSYYFKTDAPLVLSQTVGDLAENTEYSALVTAIDFYGAESDSLSTGKFITGSYVSGVSAVFSDAMDSNSAANWTGDVGKIDDNGFYISSQGSGQYITLNQKLDLGSKWMISADYYRATFNLSEKESNFSAIQVGQLTAVIQRGPQSDNMYLCYGYNASGAESAVNDKYIIEKCSLSSALGKSVNIVMTYENGCVKVYRDGFSAITVSADELKSKISSLGGSGELSFANAQVTLRLNDTWVVDAHGATFKNVTVKK